MGKNLKEDEIKTIVSVETTKAQQEIYKLTKETEKLRKEERHRRNSMIELEAQGKKNTDEYKNLVKECKEYSKQISENNKKIAESIKKLDVNSMSMTQLKKQAKELRATMDNMPKALHPETYAELESQLRKVNDRIGDLKNGGKSLAEIAKSEGTISTMFGMLFTKGAEAVGQMLQKMKDVVAEGIKMAESADGVTRAFHRMDDGTMLDSLRKATKGTVNDLDLMKAAVQAKDFRIPLEDLGKYLQFAQLKAQQTGQSVDYMTNSIVTGLGRKSLLILDNLGLSGAEINEELEKTGDFMSAVASIVDKQLAEAGENYISAADRATQKTVNLQNAQRKLGEELLPLKEKWDEVYGDAEVSTIQLIKWIVQHRAVLITLISAVTAYRVASQLATAETNKGIVATKASIILDKMKMLWITNTKGATLLYAAAKAKLTGNTLKANAAMKLFNATCKASTIGLIISLATAAGVAFLTFRKKSDEITLSMKSLNNIQSKVTEEMGNQASKIKTLSDIVHNGNLSYQERKRALDELQNIVPDYNASLTQEGKLINDNKGAIDAYLVSLEKQIKLKAAQEELEELYKKQRKTQQRLKSEEEGAGKAKSNLEGARFAATVRSSKASTSGTRSLNTNLDQGVKTMQAEYSKASKAVNKTKEELVDLDKTIQDINKEISSTADKTHGNDSVKTDLIEAKKKEIEVAEKEVASTKEEVEARNKKVAALKAELEVLQNLGVEKKKENNSAKSSINTDVAERDAIKSLEALREEDLQSQQKWYNTAKYAFDTDLKEKLITKEEHEILIAQLDNQSAQVRLQIEKNYLQDSQSLELTNGTLKEDIVRKSGQRVINAQKDVDDTRLKAEQTFQDNLDAMRKMIQQPELTPEEKLKAEYDINLGILESFYQASLEYARQNGQDETEVTETYEKAKTSLYKKYCKDKVDLANETASKLKGIAGNELSNNIADIFNMIQKLKLDMKEVPAEVGKDLLQLAALTSHALGSAFNSFKQMELDNVESRYDAEIEAAQGNADEVERLEQEKAQKKLDIEKKYADVQFAVKASEIIANTALAIMTAYGQLGPIAGSIFAALMGATGALELAVANKERQKVKNMTLSGNKSSSGTRVATGRESGGKIDVTRSQDGKLFKNADYDPDGRGFIDKPTVIVGEGPIGKSKEWVASNAAVENPTIAPFLNLLDQHQQAGDIATVDMNQIIRQRMAGFSSGGGISSPHGREESNLSSVGFTTSSVDNNDFFDKLTTLFELYLTEIKAYVVLSDIEAKQQLLDRSRSIGSK